MLSKNSAMSAWLDSSVMVWILCDSSEKETLAFVMESMEVGVWGRSCDTGGREGVREGCGFESGIGGLGRFGSLSMGEDIAMGRRSGYEWLSWGIPGGMNIGGGLQVEIGGNPDTFGGCPKKFMTGENAKGDVRG